MTLVLRQNLFPVRDYALAVTLNCGQVFRWEPSETGWEGVVGGRWVRLHSRPEGILAQALFPGQTRAGMGSNQQASEASSFTDGNAGAEGDLKEWKWLADYLQIGVDLGKVLASFPDDQPMRAAVARCHGLRLLRQEPWECLASFILSSTKQIVQIRQIIGRLCQRFGDLVPVPDGHAAAYAFPTAAQLANCDEQALRGCRMGFRAPYLLGAARMIADGTVRLDQLHQLPLDQARQALLTLPGVGRKIADCVLLFSCGFAGAFPVDVWVMKALRQLYFPKRRPSARRLRAFADTHFGPNGGLAQQYLFHYIRLSARQTERAPAPVPAAAALP